MSTRGRQADDDVCLVELGGALTPSTATSSATANTTVSMASLVRDQQHTQRQQLSPTLRPAEESSCADIGDFSQFRTSAPYARLVNDGEEASESGGPSGRPTLNNSAQFVSFQPVSAPAPVPKMHPSNDAVISELCFTFI